MNLKLFQFKVTEFFSQRNHISVDWIQIWVSVAENFCWNELFPLLVRFFIKYYELWEIPIIHTKGAHFVFHKIFLEKSLKVSIKTDNVWLGNMRK